MRKYLRKMFVITLIVFVGVLMGCSQKKEIKKETSDSLLKTVEWQDDSQKIEEFKKLSISAYPNKPIGETILSQFSVNKWQYGSSEKEEYLLCSYVDEKDEMILIFYKDSYENVNVAEYYVKEKKQPKEDMAGIVEKIFGEKEFSGERTGFFSNGKWAMEITKVDIENKKIEYYSYWWNFRTEQMEQSEVDVKTLDIVDADVMGDSDHLIEWSGIDSFNMEKYDCEILFNNDTIGSREGKSEELWNSGMGEFKRVEKPENIPVYEFESVQASPSQTNGNQGVVTAQLPPEGRYWEGHRPPLYAKYYIEVSNIQSNSFDFEIYQAQTINERGETSNHKLVFKKNTATFTDATHAVFKGQQYTLYFECGNVGYITISGFSEVIPDGSELCNTSWLQVS